MNTTKPKFTRFATDRKILSEVFYKYNGIEVLPQNLTNGGELLNASQMFDEAVDEIVSIETRLDREVRSLFVPADVLRKMCNQDYFSFNCFNTQDLVSTPKLQTALNHKKKRYEVNMYPELFKGGSGNFHFVIGTFDRDTNRLYTQFVGSVPKITEFVKHVSVSIPARNGFVHMSSTHYIHQAFVSKYITRLF